MKRGMLFSCVVILLSLFFAQGAFCQDITDADEAINAIMSNLHDKGRASLWVSHSPDDFTPILGTKWGFTETGGTTTTELTFGTSVMYASNGSAYITCTTKGGIEGKVIYSEWTSGIGGGKGFGAGISVEGVNMAWFFKISGQTASGYSCFEMTSLSYTSPLKAILGSKISDPEGNTSTNQPEVDTSTCKIMAKSMTIDSSTIPTTNDTVKFTVTAISDCTIPLYYYYSYAPNYGTDDYDANTWIKVIEGSGFTSSNTFSQKFTNPGYYVVVAWISPKMAISNPVNMIGCTVAVK